MPETPIRCPACAYRGLAATDRFLCYPTGRQRTFPLVCPSCGLLVETGLPEGELEARLRVDDFEARPDEGFGLDIYTLRTLATRFNRRALPVDERQAEALRHPHSNFAARAHLVDLAAGPSAPISLGMICRASEVETILQDLSVHADWASRILLLADGTEAAPRPHPVKGPLEGRVFLAHRPLAGDFGAQRSALQCLSPTDWMFQLDADETLSPEAAAHLGFLARMADEGGIVSVGLPRRNLVDGVMADVFPDTQYRLNRREVRFEGKVHERPVRPWQQSFIALCGAIDHHLSGSHVRSRSRRYEALAPGQGRLEEEAALLRPYRA